MINFCYTNIPIKLYKEKVDMGFTSVLHFDPIKQEDETYLCVECTISNDIIDQAETLYKEWKSKQEQLNLNYIKSAKIRKIEEYDTSTNVNGFQLNGVTVWIDKATRVGLMNSTTIAKNMGNENTTLWLGNIKIEVNCDKAIQLLSALEMYALQCFNVTAAHKKTVSELTSIKEIEDFDITADYPDQLVISIQC